MKIVVAVPTLNEIENISDFILSLRNAQPDVGILVIDDGSSDGTPECVAQLASDDPNLYILNRMGRKGLGRSYVEALLWAKKNRFSTVISMDADGSHRVEDLPSLIKESKKRDMVVGSRWVSGGSVENWPLRRLLLSKISNAFAANALKLGIKDCTSGFRAYRLSSVSELDLDGLISDGYAFQVEMSVLAQRKNWDVVEVPITFVERSKGRSKMRLQIILEAARFVISKSLKQRLRNACKS